MKAVTTLAFGLITSMALANPNYVNAVRQIQQDSGVEWDVTVASVGEMISPEGVGPQGSNFELWTLSADTGVPTFLDSEFVSAYTPAGEVQILTGDPYTITPRTRVDKPFAVTIAVEGLLGDADAPISANRVGYEHRLINFPEGSHGQGSDPVEGAIFDGYAIAANGINTLSFGVSNLTGEDLTAVEGEEVFSLYTVADESVPSELLDEKTLSVWPIAKAEILGLEAGVQYATLPPLTIRLTDLYPDSNTFVRIYPGEVSADPTDPIEINDADLVIYDVEPQDRTLTLTSLSDRLTSGGVWTIEVLHRTPWGLERLTYENPEVTNSIRIRAGLYSK